MHVSLAAFGLYFWLLLWAPVISADDQEPVSGQDLARKFVTARSLESAGINRTVELVRISSASLRDNPGVHRYFRQSTCGRIACILHTSIPVSSTSVFLLMFGAHHKG